MAVYTTDKYIKELDKKFLKLVNVKPHLEIISEVIRRQQVRIFDKGLGGDGRISPQYSKTPTYISLKASPRNFTPMGKPRKYSNIATKKTTNKKATSKFKDGKLHTSRYFPGGYAEFKTKIGKGGGGHVNLWLFGNFRTAFLNSGKNPYKSITQERMRIIAQVAASTHNPEGKLDEIFTRFAAFFDLTKGERGYIIDRNKKLLFETFS